MENPAFIGKLQRKRKNLYKTTRLRKEIHEVAVPCLNEDVILNILYKLPYKSQLRFCAVSRSWFDMIANPNRPDSCYSFSLKRYPTLLGFFYPHYEQDTLSIKWKWMSVPGQPFNELASLPESCLPLLNKPGLTRNKMKLKASSNGYLLCHRREPCEPWEGESRPSNLHYFYVINPFTQQRANLPKIKKYLPGAKVGFDCFIDDMAASPFGPIRFTVALIDNYGTQPGFDVDVKVFSSNHGQWREFQLSVANPPRDDKYVTSVGYFPGVVLKGRLFFWFCNDNNFLLKLNLDKLELFSIELPHDHDRYDYSTIHSYDYRALCAFEDHLFYGIHYQVERIIQVFIYDCDSHDFHNGRWILKYKVCLRELEQKCKEIMEVKPSENDGNLMNSSSSVYYKGFHPRNPDIIFFVFQGKFMSYDVKCQRLVVHAADDEHVPFSSYVLSELHCVPCESWAWQRSLPHIPQQ